MHMSNFEIKPATKNDLPIILNFIKELAEYERLAHEVTSTEADLDIYLFGARPYAEVVIGYLDQEPVSFALYFYNFSTFLGRPGLYIEDLYVKPEARDQDIGQTMLAYLAHAAKKRGCARMEWMVLDWNERAIGFYNRIGAKARDAWTAFRVTDTALDMLAAEWK